MNVSDLIEELGKLYVLHGDLPVETLVTDGPYKYMPDWTWNTFARAGRAGVGAVRIRNNVIQLVN